MENLNRIVIDLYKRCFADYVNGNTVDVDSISEAQRCLDFAFDRAKVNNEPTDEIESLKNDVNHLKYDLL